MVQLSPRDRALLHLFGLPRERLQDSPSEAATQEGISEVLGIPRTHISRLLRPLVMEGYIEEDKERVVGKDRRLKVYFLTARGLSRCEELIDDLSTSTFDIVDNKGRRSVRVSDMLRDRRDIPVLKILDAVGWELNLISAPGRSIRSNVPLELPAFIDREEELRISSEFLRSKSTVLVVFANYGFGSSTVLKKLAMEQTKVPLLWHDLQKGRTAEDILGSVREFARARECENEGLSGLREKEVLLCFDNYYDVSEEVVDLFFDLMKSLSGGKAKMVVAIREETPFYNRFFQKSDVTKGQVTEIHLHRFDEDSARRFMGEDLEDDAFQLIYRLTSGQPLALRLAKEGDDRSLRSLLPNEEVRFLMYLRTKKRKQ
jgi:DNA-binding MarR family transcriptional regulator